MSNKFEVGKTYKNKNTQIVFKCLFVTEKSAFMKLENTSNVLLEQIFSMSVFSYFEEIEPPMTVLLFRNPQGVEFLVGYGGSFQYETKERVFESFYDTRHLFVGEYILTKVEE